MRLKILIVLVVIPFASLAAFLFFLVQTFKYDKTTSVYELQRYSSENLILFVQNELNPVDLSENPSLFTVTFDESQGPQSRITGKLPEGLTIPYLQSRLDTICNPTRGLDFWTGPEQSHYFLICRFQYPHTTIIGKALDALVARFQSSTLGTVRLVTDDGFIMLSSDIVESGSPAANVFSVSEMKAIRDKNVRQGRASAEPLKGNDPTLMTFSKLNKFPLTLVFSTSTSIVDRAALPFLIRGGFTFLVLLILVTLIGELFSRALTTNLNKLLSLFTSFSNGNIDVRATNISKDEFGSIAKAFNQMADQIKNLLVQVRKEAESDYEMRMAAEIQRDFMSTQLLARPQCEVSGYLESSANCGGDWIYYFEVGKKTVICIADATGHGIHSALLTAAARALATEVEQSYVSPSDFMTKLNRVIYGTARGKLQMTGLIIEHDPEANTLKMSNAAHEFPVLFPLGVELQKSDLEFVLPPISPRLGENVNNTYTELTLPLEKPMGILLYSDGLADLESPEGKPFSDRNILKTLRETASGADLRVSQILENYVSKINDFRKGTPLRDDLSFVIALFNQK